MSDTTVGKTFREMTDDELKAAIRAIVRRSRTEAEIRAGITALGSDGARAAVNVRPVTDEVLRGARNLGSILGGLVSADGAMVMITMNSASGTIINL